MINLIFESPIDRQLFLHDLSINISESSLSDDLNNIIEKSVLEDREDKKIKLRDWNKASLTRKQWRTNRHKLMSGIKRFHRSTKGKQFHRKLGRKVATRDWSALNETILSVEDKSDILSSLSSIKTHLYIGLKYSSSIDEEVSYQLLCEEACNQINDIEAKILESINHSVKISLDEDQLELLRDLVLMTTSEDNTNV
jgi:hypothetical protein